MGRPLLQELQHPRPRDASTQLVQHGGHPNIDAPVAQLDGSTGNAYLCRPDRHLRERERLHRAQVSTRF